MCRFQNSFYFLYSSYDIFGAQLFISSRKVYIMIRGQKTGPQNILIKKFVWASKHLLFNNSCLLLRHEVIDSFRNILILLLARIILLVCHEFILLFSCSKSDGLRKLYLLLLFLFLRIVLLVCHESFSYSCSNSDVLRELGLSYCCSLICWFDTNLPYFNCSNIDGLKELDLSYCCFSLSCWFATNLSYFF